MVIWKCQMAQWQRKVNKLKYQVQGSVIDKIFSEFWIKSMKLSMCYVYKMMLKEWH